MLHRLSDVKNAKQDHGEPKITIQKLNTTGCYLFAQEGQQDCGMAKLFEILKARI